MDGWRMNEWKKLLDWMKRWQNKWMKEGKNGWRDGLKDKWINKWTDELIKKRKNYLILNAWVDEWLNWLTK